MNDNNLKGPKLMERGEDWHTAPVKLVPGLRESNWKDRTDDDWSSTYEAYKKYNKHQEDKDALKEFEDLMRKLKPKLAKLHGLKEVVAVPEPF